jgi:hypothetical protein
MILHPHEYWVCGDRRPNGRGNKVLVVVTYKVALVKRRMPRTVAQVVEKKVEDSHSFVIPDQKPKTQPGGVQIPLLLLGLEALRTGNA